MPPQYALFRQLSEELVSDEGCGVESVQAFVDINLVDGVVYPSIRVIGQYDQSDLLIFGEGYEKTHQSLEVDTLQAIPELGETEDLVSTILETTFIVKDSGTASVQLKGHRAMAHISWFQTATGFLLFDFEGHGLEVNHEEGIIREVLEPNLARDLLDNKNRIKAIKYATSTEEKLAMLQDISKTHHTLVQSIPTH
jgi:hypothetical protein